MRILTTLDRYLFNQFMGPFVLAVFGFAIIGMVDILFYLVELTVISGIPFHTIIQLLMYKLPAVMVMFFPMAVLFSVMLMMVRMAKDNELTILRTSGVPSSRIVIPIILITVFTSLLSYVTNEKLVPWTNERSNQLIREQIEKTPPISVAENIIFKDAENRFFYIKHVNSKNGVMENLLIFEETTDFPRVISAKKALWHQSSWTLVDGFIQETDSDGSVQFLDHFDEMTIHITQDLDTFFKQEKSAKEMDSKELKERIKTLNKGGINTQGLKVEYYMKTSIPFGCAIFGLIGIAYCLSFVRTGKDWWGVIVAIIIAVLSVGLYLFITALFRAFAKDGNLDPLWGAWIPNIIYGSLAGVITIYQCLAK